MLTYFAEIALRLGMMRIFNQQGGKDENNHK